jgi:hypothetical protein
LLEDLFSEILLIESFEVGNKVGQMPGPPTLDLVGECRITEFVFVVECADGGGRGRAGGDMVLRCGL